MKLRNWTKSRGAVAAFVVFLSADLAAGVGAASLAVAASVSPQSEQFAAAASSSVATIAWDSPDRVITDPNYDLFKDLVLTVGQTENLSNQGIDVTWTGGATTSSGDYDTNYLQFMQCWGDAATGPTPQQCQWGAPASNLGSLMGSNTGTRNLVEFEDPAQLYSGAFMIPAPQSNLNQRAFSVPFTPVKGQSTFNTDIYFSTSSTNEVTAARTGEDGTGQVVFETQTSLEAPHLGCGAPVSGGAGRSCWLVAVPRGEFNADGSPATVDASNRVVGSPLSATNWANRIQVSLKFAAVGDNCPIGNAERRTAGSELVADAFTSWQSVLCATGTTYGYSLIGDQEARSQLVSGLDGAAGLAFVNEPLTSDESASSTIEYAPIVTSGVVIAFNIERNLTSNSPNFSRNGTPVTELVLNQRLVAKLLTQSYKSDVPNGNNQAHVAGNPRSIRNDQEFLQLNPEFSSFASSAAPDGLMVSLGSTDATAQVWNWIKGDPSARAFLEGTADEWGMRVNPAYSALKLTEDAVVDSFPKADLSTYRQFTSIPEPGFGTLDLRPYVLDMHEGASRARRADANVKIVWDDTRNPPSFVSSGPQLPGARFSMAIVDTASAAQYGLPTAKLVNAAGRAVAADAAGLQAGVSAMVNSEVDGVVVVDPDKRASGAYPLTMVTYAAINVCSTPLAGLTEYAKLLEYSAGAGQVVGNSDGQLPAGYLPLTSSFTAQTSVAVKAIRAEVKKPKCTEHQKVEPVPVEEPIEEFEVAQEEEVAAEPVATSSPTPQAEALVEQTPTSSGGATRFAFLAALLFGIPFLTAGPILLRRS